MADGAHLFIRSSAGVQDLSGLSVEGVQVIGELGAGGPHDRFRISVGGGDDRRAAAEVARAPGNRNSWRRRCADAPMRNATRSPGSPGHPMPWSVVLKTT